MDGVHRVSVLIGQRNVRKGLRGRGMEHLLKGPIVHVRSVVLVIVRGRSLSGSLANQRLLVIGRGRSLSIYLANERLIVEGRRGLEGIWPSEMRVRGLSVSLANQLLIVEWRRGVDDDWLRRRRSEVMSVELLPLIVLQGDWLSGLRGRSMKGYLANQLLITVRRRGLSESLANRRQLEAGRGRSLPERLANRRQLEAGRGRGLSERLTNRRQLEAGRRRSLEDDRLRSRRLRGWGYRMRRRVGRALASGASRLRAALLRALLKAIIFAFW